MSSPKKRKANRINALKSTGPKSQVGKKLVGQNAIRHGLSKAIDARVFHTEIEAIVALLEQDCIPSETARNLALKIIDFERNLAEQRQVYLSQTSPPEDPGARSKRMKAAVPEIDMMVEHLSEPDLYDKPLTNKEHREGENVLAKLIRFADVNDKRQTKDHAKTTEHYYKRSSNQLMKAIKATFKD